MVLDGQAASLQVGDLVPYLSQTSQSTTTSDAPVISSINYQETGVILHVTPHVGSDGLVTLDLDQQVSGVSPTITTTGLNSPTFTERAVTSRVAIQDGQTVGLAGLISDNDSQPNQGIPFPQEPAAARRPLRLAEQPATREELLVLITPHVVRNQQQALDLTADLQQQLPNAALVPNALQTTPVSGSADPDEPCACVCRAEARPRAWLRAAARAVEPCADGAADHQLIASGRTAGARRQSARGGGGRARRRRRNTRGDVSSARAGPSTGRMMAHRITARGATDLRARPKPRRQDQPQPRLNRLLEGLAPGRSAPPPTRRSNSRMPSSPGAAPAVSEQGSAARRLSPGGPALRPTRPTVRRSRELADVMGMPPAFSRPRSASDPYQSGDPEPKFADPVVRQALAFSGQKAERQFL